MIGTITVYFDDCGWIGVAEYESRRQARRERQREARLTAYLEPRKETCDEPPRPL